ncbi:hypothetical protein BGZ65_007905, partial [Modicella reniformis]
MSESSSSKPFRRQRETAEYSNTSPPAKKPMYSIFEKSGKPIEPADIRWKTNGKSFIVGEAFDPKPGSKVAGFDLDSTLIKVNGKHKWPKNADDWVWWAPGVPKHLQKVADEGYTIVVITNQNGLDGNLKKQDEMRTKFEKICSQLHLPMWILISMQKDQNRKPMTGLWHWIEARFQEADVEIDYTTSYYIGDAAGRQDGWKEGAIKDFNNTDRKFAASLDIQFYTPEHFFLDQHCPDDKWSYGDFDPKTWPKDTPLFSPTSTPLLPSPATCEMIVLCGYPASGKSSFAYKHIIITGQYDYVNQDTLKTKDRCLKAAEGSLQKRRAVVVDNTNPDVSARAPYIALAKKHNVPVRCFIFTADVNLATHNNYFRAFHRPLMDAIVKGQSKEVTTTVTATTTSSVSNGKETMISTNAFKKEILTNIRDETPRERLPDIVFATFAKRYQEPTLDEGFTEIKKINFVPDEEIKATWERCFTTASEFLVLRASSIVPKTDPAPQRPPSPFSSEFDRAIRRDNERKTVRSGGKRKGDDLDDAEVKSVYKKTCREWISEYASSSLRKGEAKQDSQGKLFRREKSGLPKGVRKKAFDDLKASHEKAKDLSEAVLKRKLGEDGTVAAWNELVDTSFDNIWESEAATLANEDNDSDDGDHEDDPNDGAKSKQQALRTCTSTLKQVLRPDVLEVGDGARILELFESSQRELTTVMEELSVLALKATHVIARGELYSEVPSLHGDRKPSKSIPPPHETFDIHDILPHNFKLRDGTVHTELRVAPLPPHLQDHLAANIDKQSGKDDISSLLSSGHLKSLYARFLSSSQKETSVNNKHPVWNKLEENIRNSSDVNDLSKAPNGISLTINQHIQEFATNVENIWQGSTYNKLLDYLLRILLRLHLAPKREQKTRERATGVSKRNQHHDTERNRKRRDKSKIGKLCIELELWMHKDPEVREERVTNILRQLCELGPTNSMLIAGGHPLSTPKAHITSVEDENDLESLDSDDDWDREDEGEDDQKDNKDVSDNKDGSDNMDGSDNKEPSRANLMSLQALLKVLLESPALDGKINGAYVKKSAFVGNKFTEEQCNVVAMIVNALGPYVPKRRPNPEDSGPKTLPPIAHVALRAPLMMIANAVLRGSGYTQFTRLMSPQISPSSTHALHLNAIGLYEVLCSKEPDHFDVVDTNKNPLTYVNNVRDHKRAVFGAFFNVEKVEQLCRAHGLRFADRVSFVDRFTIRITGEVIPKGQDRINGPVHSQYEDRRKNKKAGAAFFDWGEEVALQGMDEQEILQVLENVDRCITEKEAIVKPLRKELSQKEHEQSSAAVHHRSVSTEDKTPSPQRTATRKEAYRPLQEARSAVRECRARVMPLNADIRRLRRERYYWNNVLKACREGRKARRRQGSSNKQWTTPTLDDFTVEDSVEHMDISQLPRDRIVFAGTDPGVKKMSVTCAQTLQEIETHINRYQVLYPGDDEQSSVQSTSASEVDSTQGPPTPAMTFARHPSASIITAPQVNEVSSTRKIARRREIRLRRPENASAREALGGLSKHEQVLRTAQDMKEIDEAHKLHQESRSVLKDFETSKA